MNTAAEITQRQKIIAEATKEMRRLKREAKILSGERKGWAETIETASQQLEMLEAGDVDGFQQTLASAIEDKADD